MRDRIVRGMVAVLLLAVAAKAAPPDAPVPGPKAGSITALLPTANIVRGPAKQEVTAVAKKGDEVVWNDVVRTDKGGRARITLLDQSILSVGSQAELRIIKSDAKSQQTSIEVGYGRVRAEVAPVTKQGGNFEVKTPTAVAGVIGTVFGIDSAIGGTTFLCVSGTVMVGSNDPTIPGRVPCTAGMAAVVSSGKAPATRPATQREIQQLVQDTEPAVISAMNPSSLLPGATADATITGTQLGNVNAVSSSSPSVTATLNAGGTATSVSVHLVVAANATPGPVTLTLNKPSGVGSAAVFTVSPSQAGAAAGGGAPSIKGLSTTAAPSTGGVSVTITGTNFDPNSKVMFGNVASSNVTFVSPTQLTVITPPGNPGTVDITVVTGGGMSTTLSGGFSFGGPVATISPQEKTVNPGEQVTLDGSRSSDTLAGTTLTYSWTFCSLGFKPPQAGASLPPMNAPACNPAPGTVSGTDSMFALTPPAAPGQYFARLQVTDNLGASAVFYSSVTVSQPSYDDPVTRMNSLAQAFSTLQSSSVLGFFDSSYTGLTSLQQSLQTVFPTYSSMTVNLLSVTPTVSGTTAIITANWQLKYTFKGTSTVLNSTPESVQTVWTLTPGKGWFVTDFRLPNGFTQGTLPAVPVTTTSQVADLTISITGDLTQSQITYTLTVSNIGAASTNGSVTVTDTLPTGLTATAISGMGWTCTLATLMCTRADPLVNGSSYPAITLTVNVAANAPASVTNTATVAGGGEVNTANDTATVLTNITTIIIASSRGNTSSNTPVELNGILPEAMTITATRSDGITTGSVTLTLASAPEVASNPAQVTGVPYNSPQAVDFAATINASGNVSAVPTTVVVTPSQAVPAAGSTPTTLYFNVGDINLTGVPSCLLVAPGGGQAQLNLGFQLVNGFNAPNLSWQWSGLTAGVLVNTPSGNAVFSGGAYNPPLPAFTFTNNNVNPISGPQTFLFAVTVSNAQGGSSATKVFALTFGLGLPTAPCGQAARVGGGVVTGTWSRGAFGGGMAKAARPVQTGALPDLQINAASVSFTPSIPKPGDTVAVRFRVTNAGNADAQHVPIALVVSGVTVASQPFDIRAGASTLAALEWPDAHTASVSGSLQAAVVVDPNHTVVEKSALAKSAPLVHFAWLPGPGAQTGTQLAAVQRATLEVADGGCVGFRFASGAGSACGSADVEISVEQMASGRFTLAAQVGIADLGPAFGGGKLAVVQYQPEVPAVAGHSYAVQLRGGKTGILRLTAIRNPGQTTAKSRQVFGAGKVAGNVGTGQTTGPVETGDVSGVRTPSQSKAYFDVSYQTQ